MRSIGIRMPILLLLMIAAMSINYAGASGVLTLTGTCRSPVLTNSSNTVYLYISSSGNVSATNLQVIPRLEGATVYPSVESLQSLSPGENASFSFNLSNFTEPGSYAGEFFVEYTQGSSLFFPAFPCEYAIIKPTQSLLSILNVTPTPSSVKATILSLESKTVNASISVLISPSSQPSPAYENVTLAPLSKYNATFQLVPQPLQSGSAVPLSVAVSYSKDGEHYASMFTTVMLYKSTAASRTSFLYIFIGVFAAIVVIIAVLILLAVAKAKGRSKANRQ